MYAHVAAGYQRGEDSSIVVAPRWNVKPSAGTFSDYAASFGPTRRTGETDRALDKKTRGNWQQNDSSKNSSIKARGAFALISVAFKLVLHFI